MISIVICSVNPSNLEQIQKNISETIGLEHEFVPIDNRESCNGLCKVYNQGAELSHGDYLCFVHEDVLFETTDWGKLLVDFIEGNKNCGVIGFGGGEFVSKFYLSWFEPAFLGQHLGGMQLHCTLPSIDNKHKYERCVINRNNEKFASVITLDGYFLFCKKTIWEKVKFDEKVFDGFHFYDQDFTFGIYNAGFKNYVCHLIETIHFSRGNYSSDYNRYARRFREKYKLSHSVTLRRMNALQLFICDLVAAWNLFRFEQRMGVRKACIKEDIRNSGGKYWLVYLLILKALRFLRVFFPTKVK